MADARDVRTIVEDKTTGAGVALKGKVKGDAVADIQMPVFPCEDSSGNEAKIPLGSDGGIVTSPGILGTAKHNNATVSSVVTTDTDVAVISLTTLKVYNCLHFSGSSTKTVLWKFIQDDDGTETTLMEAITGPGDFTFDLRLDKKEITAGSTGVQELKVVGFQLRGPVSDLHATVEANEKP